MEMNSEINIKTKNEYTEPTSTDIFELLTHFTTYCKKRIEIYGKMKIKQRQPNFPEDISENIVKLLMEHNEKIKVTWNITTGDLLDMTNNKKIKVKCFSSTGSTSFGPTEKWDYIYFLDAIDFINMNFKCYKVSLSNDHDIWKNIKINKNETYNDQCLQGIRPIITYLLLEKQIPKEYINEIFKGSIEKLLK